MSNKPVAPIDLCRSAALNYLARREHAPKELQRKLANKDFSPEDIQAVLTQLSQENVLSTTRFVENYIHYRRNRGFGPVRIKLELVERGVADSIIDRYLSTNDVSWFDLAAAVLQKKLRGKIPGDFQARAKYMRFLHGRGFTSEQIEKSFNTA